MDFLTVLFFVLSLISSLLTGQFAGAALLRGAEEGARLALTLAGPLCLWSGFAALLEGEEQPINESAPVVVFDEYGPARMIRTYVDKYVCRYPYGPDEYYDLKGDPGEERNLIDAPEHALRIRELKRQLEAWFARYADPAIDGRHERVSGNGQLDRAGVYAEGRQNYEPLGHTLKLEV